MESDIKKLVPSLCANLEIQTKIMEQRYQEAIERIYSAGRTELANKIALLWHETMLHIENTRTKLTKKHNHEVNGIDKEYKRLRKNMLTAESTMQKYNAQSDKCLILARRAALDIEVYNKSLP